MSLWHGRNANCMPTMYDKYEPSEWARGGDVTYDEQLSDGGGGEHRQTEEDGRTGNK